MHATKAAVEEGIVPGGGVALLRAAKVLEHLQVAGDEQIGVKDRSDQGSPIGNTERRVDRVAPAHDRSGHFADSRTASERADVVEGHGRLLTGSVTTVGNSRGTVV
jgi:hypothetical protein